MNLFIEQPRKAQAVQMYSRLYFATRVQPEFQAEWDAKVAILKAQGKEMPKVGVSDRAAVTRKCWEREGPELRQTVLDEVEKEYEEAMTEYKRVFGEAPKVGKALDW